MTKLVTRRLNKSTLYNVQKMIGSTVTHSVCSTDGTDDGD